LKKYTENMAQKNKSIELAEIIRGQITSGQFTVGDQLEAISKLAKRYGTTIATVSKALENLEQSGYVERFPGKGVFIKAKKTCRLAVVMDTGFSYELMPISFFPVFINELDKKCRELNWTHQLFFSVNDHESAKEFLLQLSQNKFDAILIASRWLAENYNSVALSCSAAAIGLFDYKGIDSSVIFDSISATTEAVHALAEQGCQQIAFINSDQDKSWHRNSETSHTGYLNGLKEVCKLRDSDLDIDVPLSQLGGLNGFYELIRHKKSSPMGIIISDSIITFGVIQGVLAKGLKIPEDIIIATHANKGCGAADFPFPAIKLEYSIEQLLDYLITLITNSVTGNNIKKGIHWIEANLLNPFKETLNNSMALNN
jgi:DNA-binding LacI/PurR family transcriptional regulator